MRQSRLHEFQTWCGAWVKLAAPVCCCTLAERLRVQSEPDIVLVTGMLSQQMNLNEGRPEP